MPLVGPPTHVGGYTIGPAFYWILWAIRVSVGPWFDNLPHAGGIGQAMLQSAADTLLLAAVWYRTRSIGLALTAVVVLATAAYDLCLAPLVWNPVMGSTLAKAATALVLLDWPAKSSAKVALTAALAWSAVHAYTGAIFVAVGVFAALVLEPMTRRDRPTALRNAALIAAAVVILELPLLVFEMSNRGPEAMGAVTDSLRQIATGHALPEVTKSVRGYAAAVIYRGARGSCRRGCCSCAVHSSRSDTAAIRFCWRSCSAPASPSSATRCFSTIRPLLLPLADAGSRPDTLPARRRSPSASPIAAGVLLVAAVALSPARMRYAASLHRCRCGALVEGLEDRRRAGDHAGIVTGFNSPRRAIHNSYIRSWRPLDGSPWVGTTRPMVKSSTEKSRVNDGFE